MGVPVAVAFRGRSLGNPFAGKDLQRFSALGTPLELDGFEEPALPRMLAPNAATPLVWGKREALLQAAAFLFAGEERADPTPKRMTTAMTKKTEKGTAIRCGLSRRAFLKASAGTAALVGALQTNFSAGVHIAEAAGPEVTKAVLGYIALTDASPLVDRQGEGLLRQARHARCRSARSRLRGARRATTSCSARRGNGIDGAHILTPMPYLISTGKVTQNNVPTPMYILARLNLDAPGDLGRARNTRTSRSAPTPRRSRRPSRRRRRPARR